nr:MAG: RNA-dependent RNA polymerase [Narnaviridae sp.]
MMAPVSRLIKFYDTLSSECTSTAVLPEITCLAGSQTPLAGASTQSVSLQHHVSGRQPRESYVPESHDPGASLQAESRASSDTSQHESHMGERQEKENPQFLTALKDSGLLSELGSDFTDSTRSNPYTVLVDEDDVCLRSRALAGRARQLVKWFASFGLPRSGDLPATIKCGGLRSAVRQCFSDVDLIWELSFKTIQKIERSCCKLCLPLFEQKLSQWKEDRSRPKPVDEQHLALFREALLRNVDKGWDRRRRPFIPNGNATRCYTRRDGGNWRREEMSSEFRTELVFSSGKPRVVTLYSSDNTAVLAPLHYSLYDSLRRKGWLLVGDPTDRHVGRLTGAEFLSFDYSSATDNIKTRYVQCAISVLLEQADNISDDERYALSVLGSMVLEGKECGSGQPMGSVMSFPLLCLINKTVVDLAMNRLLVGKKISFNEWSSHRCLINGDDLLIREVRKDTNLRELIPEEGLHVGLIVNQEKTLRSDRFCEINSTLFEDGHRVRKFNASSIWMDPGVEDVLGFAAESTTDVKTFRKVVRWNSHILAKSKDKHLAELPAHLQVVCRKDKKIRRALTSLPETERPILPSVIQMAPRPDGYYLEVDEEHQSMRDEIERVRERGVNWASARSLQSRFKTSSIPNQISYSQVLKRRKRAEQELIPACYVRTYNLKVRNALVRDEVAFVQIESFPPSDGSLMSSILDNLRLFKQKRAVCDPGTTSPLGDFVSLA